jgi:ATPase subunit of ABC transporter with duplicated ATPase domains
LNFKLPPGGIVGVIGPNGAGKIDAVQDDHRPGKARQRQRSRSATVHLGYVDQSRDHLDPEERLGGNLRRQRRGLSSASTR